MEELSAKKHFDILDGGIACILFVVLNFLFDVVYSMVPRNIRVNFWGNIFFTILLESIFVVICLLVVYFRHKGFTENTTLNKKINWPIVGLCLLISVVCIVLFSDVTNAFGYTLDSIGYIQYPDPIVNAPNFVLTYFLNIIIVCVLPALCEEILFRGLILNSFRGLNKWLGITVSAVAFMLMHGNPEQTIHQLLLGFVLGYIVWETRNIWTSILIHFFNNFIAITLSLILTIMRGEGAGSGDGVSETISSTQLFTTWFVGLGMMVVGLLLVFWIAKYLKKQSQKANGELKQTTHVASATVDGQQTEIEMVVQEQAGESIAEPEEKQSPTPTMKYVAIVGYILFAAKCIYDWVSVLIYHLP